MLRTADSHLHTANVALPALPAALPAAADCGGSGKDGGMEEWICD